MAWVECWGTYAATGPYNNVVMGGSPANSMYGLDLLPAKAAGYGNGIEFRYSQDINQLYVHINLIGYGSDPNNNYIANQEYVHGNFTYDWYVDIFDICNATYEFFCHVVNLLYVYMYISIIP